MFDMTGVTEFLVIPMLSGDGADIYNYFFSLVFWPSLVGWGFLMIIELVSRSATMRGKR